MELQGHIVFKYNLGALIDQLLGREIPAPNSLFVEEKGLP